MGLVIPDRVVQPGDVPCWDIRRVAGDHVKVPQSGCWRLHGVDAEAGDTGVELVAAHILLAHPQGSLGQLAQHHPAGRHLGGDGQPHAAASGAQVQHPGPLPRRPGQEDRALGQHFRVGPGDDDLPGDVQGQAVKLPFPDDVGHRLTGQTAPGQLLHPALHLV